MAFAGSTGVLALALGWALLRPSQEVTAVPFRTALSDFQLIAPVGSGERLRISPDGSKIVFANAGAYSLVKANYFNGINLPSIYALTAEGELVLEKKFTYEDFARQCGAVEHENN